MDCIKDQLEERCVLVTIRFEEEEMNNTSERLMSFEKRMNQGMAEIKDTLRAIAQAQIKSTATTRWRP